MSFGIIDIIISDLIDGIIPVNIMSETEAAAAATATATATAAAAAVAAAAVAAATTAMEANLAAALREVAKLKDEKIAEQERRIAELEARQG